MPSIPSDAGAMVVLGGPDLGSVYWAERAPGNVFLAGYRAFVGGRVEPGDLEVGVTGELASPGSGPASGAERLSAVAAVRELFEETGLLVARSVAPIDTRALAAARAELPKGRPFAAVLGELGATIDLALLRRAGRWVTPAFAPRRFDTHFFLASCPPGQQPSLVEGGEIQAGDYVRPGAAVAAWERAEALVPPPVLHILRALALGMDGGLEARLLKTPLAQGVPFARIEFLPGIVLVPLKTETLPPATTTNAYVIGRERALVVDPAASDPAEQEKLARVIEDLLGEGVKLEAMVLTHHHPDHVGGVEDLRRRYRIPVWAHSETEARLGGRVVVDRRLADEERLDLGAGYALVAMHTPGHAAGHLCLREERTRALLTGDNVVGFGTVLIDPEEGDMEAYLQSLRRLLSTPARALFGGHGPAVAHGETAIRALIAHRLWREGEVLRAVAAGARTLDDIARAAYPDAKGETLPLARRQAQAHLARLARKGKVRPAGEGFEATG